MSNLLNEKSNVETRTPAALPFPPYAKSQESATLSDFRARAVIDWIEVEIAMQGRTNFQTIQRHLRKILGADRNPWVKALDEGPGGAASRFAVRLQDPGDYPELKQVLDQLAAQLPFRDDPVIRAIEVAVDFYSKRNAREDIEGLVLRLKHNLQAQGDLELECGPITYRVENVMELRADHTLIIEARGIKWRAYLKETDDNRKPIADPTKHRARVEVTLSEGGLPADLMQVDDLRVFRFEQLTPLFSFRKLVPGATVPSKPNDYGELLQEWKINRARRCGQRRLWPPRPRERRKYSNLTQADSELKERARDALRELTRRFCAKKSGKSSF